MKPLFGPAGNSDSFAAAGFKSVDDAPGYVAAMGLDAYEYQGGHGIHISEEHAKAFGRLAADAGVALSVHAPYYISMSGVEEQKRENSVGYILQTARAAKFMGAPRIVVHSGSCGGITREVALALAKDTLSKALEALDAEGLGDIHICPETMGKVNQLGTVDEVMELCSLDERLIPCIDFGHINARTFGGLKTPADFEAIFDAMEGRLGESRMRLFHSHFSKVEYTPKGGEKNHLTFEDRLFGPEFGPVAELVYKKGCSPVLICESAGTQAEDAREMKRIFDKISEGD